MCLYKCACKCVFVSCGRPHPQRTQSGQRRWSDKRFATRPPARPLERKRSWAGLLTSDRTANSNYESHSPPGGFADMTARTNLRTHAHKHNNLKPRKGYNTKIFVSKQMRAFSCYQAGVFCRWYHTVVWWLFLCSFLHANYHHRQGRW